MIEHLSFRPFPGLSSPHVQTVLATFSRPGPTPPSIPYVVPLEDGDALYCEMSTSPDWHPTEKTVIMVHGLGGSHSSSYMVRISRKLYQAGYRIIRVNLRGCGSGRNLEQRPYHGGTSHDVLHVIQDLKKQNPLSPHILLGFSLGGNIALKLAGELGEEGGKLLHHTIAICPPIDLAQTVHLLSKRDNRFYNRYYLRGMRKGAARWAGKQPFKFISDFDNAVTAPQWGFQDAADYYLQSSSRFLLSEIRHRCDIVFAADDPFVDYQCLGDTFLHSSTKIWLSQYGGHLGFLGWAGGGHGYFWLDRLLQNWISDKAIDFAHRGTGDGFLSAKSR